MRTISAAVAIGCVALVALASSSVTKSDDPSASGGTALAQSASKPDSEPTGGEQSGPGDEPGTPDGALDDGAIEAGAPFRLGPPAPARPARVVSLSPALTDLVIALGRADRLVGVTRFCDGPEVSEVDRVGGFVDPSIEAVLSAEPDLVLVEPSPGNREVVLRLGELGLPVLVLPHGAIDEARAAFLTAADALHARTRGEKLVRELDETISKIRREVEKRPVRRAAVLYGREPLVLAGPGSFADELLGVVGAENVAEGAGVAYPTFPLELLIARAPDVIIETTMSSERSSSPLPGLGSSRHVVLPKDTLLRPGPSLPEAARHVLFAVHPETSLEKSSNDRASTIDAPAKAHSGGHEVARGTAGESLGAIE